MNFSNAVTLSKLKWASAAVVSLPLIFSNAYAETFTVSTETELRDAIFVASSNLEADTIDLAGSTIELTSGTLVYEGAGQGELSIVNGLILRAEDAPEFSLLHLLGQFAAFGDSVELNNLVLGNGVGVPTTRIRGGGAVFSELPLSIESSSFFNNSANPPGGTAGTGGAVLALDTLTVVFSAFDANQADGAGGAISSSNSLNVLSSVFLDNSTTDRGGALFAAIGSSLEISGSTFDGNSALQGGAIFGTGVQETTRIELSTFLNNDALTTAGAMWFQDSDAVTLNRLTLWNNNADLNNASGVFAFGTDIELFNTFIGADGSALPNVNCVATAGGSFTEANASGATDETCGVPNINTDPNNTNTASGASGTVSTYFLARSSVNQVGATITSDTTRGIEVFIPLEGGPLQRTTFFGEVPDGPENAMCGPFDQRPASFSNAVLSATGFDFITDGLCDIGSIELIERDGDEIYDVSDNCPEIANADQANSDEDGLGDACDSDDDNDTVPDDQDAFPLDPDESVDTDGDGVGNATDTDDDGDGQSDVDELECGSNPLLSTSLSIDVDNDNIPDCVDEDLPIGAPMCDGEIATVYVDSNNIIVGGRRNGTVYEGTLAGTSGRDVIVGTAESDTILALLGNDLVCAEGGNDLVRGDAGFDTLNGGDGDDILNGGIGNDTMSGNAGDDVLNGFIGRDTLNGDDGNDRLNGGGANDILNGGAGNDVLNGGDARDILSGGEGNDTLNGSAGFDDLFGNAGDDVLNGNRGNDLLDGGDGDDSGNGGPNRDTCRDIETMSSC